MAKKNVLICVLGFMLCGCSPYSSEDFQKEGEQLCRCLAETLSMMETPEQLVLAEPDLKKKFESLVALMIEANRFRERHPDQWDGEESLEPRFVSETLKEQLHRIYLMEGGREIIERAQHESLVKLDAYERSRLKQREKLK